MKRRLAKEMMPVVNPLTTYPSLIPLDEWLVLKETNETCFADGKRKLVGLGWEGERLGEGIGWENIRRQGEGLPTRLVERYRNRHRDVLKCDLVGVDKDKLSESELRKLVLCQESGAKVVNQEDKLYVSVLSLGPNGVRTSIAVQQREKPEKSTPAASEKGIEVEMPPGVFIGPELRPVPPITTKINRRRPDQRLSKNTAKYRERLARKKLLRDEEMRRKELVRDEKLRRN